MKRNDFILSLPRPILWGNPKDGEKGFVIASKPFHWTTLEEWEARKKKKRKHRHAY